MFIPLHATKWCLIFIVDVFKDAEQINKTSLRHFITCLKTWKKYVNIKVKIKIA